MKAVVAKLRLNSLYSVRVPFTWQSSQTYPVLPPSAVIGLYANALQRFKNDIDPKEWLRIINTKAIWAGSRLLSPAVVRSYMTSAVVKWGPLDPPYKFTNALGRQFAFAQEVEIASVFEDEEIIKDLKPALQRVPLFFGDSESSVTVEAINEAEAEFISEKEVETAYPVPFTGEMTVIKGSGKVMLMHERCGVEESQPLHTYIVPIHERKNGYIPTLLKVKMSEKSSIRMRVISIKGFGKVVIRDGLSLVLTHKQRRRR